MIKVYLNVRGVKLVTTENVKIVDEASDADLVIADKDFTEDADAVIYLRASLSNKSVGLKGVGDFDVLSIPVNENTFFVDGILKNKAGLYSFVADEKQYTLKDCVVSNGVVKTTISVDLTGTGEYQKQTFALVVGDESGFAFAGTRQSATSLAPNLPVSISEGEQMDMTMSVMDILEDMQVDPVAPTYTQQTPDGKTIQVSRIPDSAQPWENDNFDNVPKETLSEKELNDPNALTEYGQELL